MSSMKDYETEPERMNITMWVRMEDRNPPSDQLVILLDQNTYKVALAYMPAYNKVYPNLKPVVSAPRDYPEILPGFKATHWLLLSSFPYKLGD